MSDRKAYPLRINTEVLAAMQRWSDDELRSVNAQIEYVLRDALRRAGRLRGGDAAPAARRDSGHDRQRSDQQRNDNEHDDIPPGGNEEQAI